MKKTSLVVFTSFAFASVEQIEQQFIVRRISASFQYSCAKNGKGLKLGTKETDTSLDQ